MKKMAAVEKYLLAIYDMNINEDEEDCIQDVVIINNKKEAEEEFNRYCNVETDLDTIISNNMRVVLAKFIKCTDIEVVTTVKKTVVI